MRQTPSMHPNKQKFYMACKIRAIPRNGGDFGAIFLMHALSRFLSRDIWLWSSCTALRLSHR